MIRAKFCFAAEGIIRDAESNNISAFNILEGLASEGFPFFMQRLAFIVLWERDDGDPEVTPGRFRLSIGDQDLSVVELNVNFSGSRRHRSVIRLNGLIVPRPGTLQFQITLEAGARAEYRLEIATPQAALAQVAP